MIGGWLFKVLAVIGLLGFAVIELGSPLVARAQTDDAAHTVADDTAFRIRANTTRAELEALCADRAVEQHVTIARCEINAAGEVEVAVTKQARSFLLAKFGPTKKWYEVEATATAARK